MGFQEMLRAPETQPRPSPVLQRGLTERVTAGTRSQTQSHRSVIRDRTSDKTTFQKDLKAQRKPDTPRSWVRERGILSACSFDR